MCHLGTLFCPIWRPLFICGAYSLCSSICLCVCVCVHNPSPKENSFLDPWSLSSYVCGYLKPVVFVRNNTGVNPVLLIPCMDYEWKTGDFTDSKANRDHQTTPYFWPWCVWHLDEEQRNSSANEGKDLHCWKMYETSISSHQMIANTISFPGIDMLILSVMPRS